MATPTPDEMKALRDAALLAALDGDLQGAKNLMAIGKMVEEADKDTDGQQK